MGRRRLDTELVARGLAATQREARDVIERRVVLVDGAPAMKPSTLIAPGSRITLARTRRFVTRGGDKLEGALSDLGVDPSGMRCLDAGAGQGGFTDCLLRSGAREVVAVDVAYGELDWKLRGDPRVRVLERANLRTVAAPDLEQPFDLVVADLSFISLVAVLDRLISRSGPAGSLLLLVKPQFEAAREEVEPGGIVSDPEVWERVLASIADGLAERGFGVAGIAPSRLRGAEGNQEFFVLSRRGARGSRPDLIRRAVESVR